MGPTAYRTPAHQTTFFRLLRVPITHTARVRLTHRTDLTFVSFVFMPVNVCQCLESLGSFAVTSHAEHDTNRLFHQPQAALSSGPGLRALTRDPNLTASLVY